jgi:hypothetical protein
LTKVHKEKSPSIATNNNNNSGPPNDEKEYTSIQDIERKIDEMLKQDDLPMVYEMTEGGLDVPVVDLEKRRPMLRHFLKNFFSSRY